MSVSHIQTRDSSLDLARWTKTNIHSPPHTVVVPRNFPNILDIIKYAKSTGLKVIPAGGGHGSFLPIDHNTLYLDLKEMQGHGVKLDETNGIVTFGAGANAGEVSKELSAVGWYTSIPNSNAVGKKYWEEYQSLKMMAITDR
jgi:FAD/FMN-containing dehydrogenase